MKIKINGGLVCLIPFATWALIEGKSIMLTFLGVNVNPTGEIIIGVSISILLGIGIAFWSKENVKANAITAGILTTLLRFILTTTFYPSLDLTILPLALLVYGMPMIISAWITSLIRK